MIILESSKDQVPSDDNLRTEYHEAGENWRFFIKTRFIAVGYFATFNSLLLALVGWVIKELPYTTKIIVLSIIPPFGAIMSLVFGLMDYRSLQLFLACLSRAKKIEEHLSLKNGLYYCLDKAGKREKTSWFTITHSKAIFVVYACMYILWVLFSFFRYQLASIK